MSAHTEPLDLTLQEAASLITSAPPVELLDKMVEAAGLLSASDIHLEPEKEALRVRFRLDGELIDVADLSLEHTPLIISRIKLLSGLKLNIKDMAQDGSFSTKVNDTNYDIRVSVVPAQYGESAVLRLLPQTGKFLTLDELGLEGHNLDVIQQIIKRPNGLILNTGPTGSGKTTTLYSILSLLNKPGIKIITLEDPIEYRMEGISQTEVNTKEGYSFADGLKAALRQDPDIILVGEIRDAETAKTAVQAALTGHLVLSTLHTNDAAGALPRLVELGVAPNLFSEAVAGIIAQRLVRTLNPSATAGTAPWPEWANEVYDSIPPKERELRLPTLPPQMPAAGTGPSPYKGRTGIYETLVITPEIDKLIQNSASVRELRDQAIKDGMVTMAQDGFIKIASGKTTLEEVQKTVLLP